MDLSGVMIQGNRRKVTFAGSCFETHPVCQAMCCREWVIQVSPEEHASGRYSVDQTCSLTGKECRDKGKSCLNRIYQLKKSKDGSCIYLNSGSYLCTIYSDRPRVCREFSCRSGWKLSSIFLPEDKTPDAVAPDMKLTREIFLAKVDEGAIFVPHPLIRVSAVFCIKDKREVIFFKEMAGSCGRFYTREHFENLSLDDADWMALISCFSKRKPLGDILRIFNSENGIDLSKQDLLEATWLLNKHNVVLDSRNFRGMLSGIGGI